MSLFLSADTLLLCMTPPFRWLLLMSFLASLVPGCALPLRLIRSSISFSSPSVHLVLKSQAFGLLPLDFPSLLSSSSSSSKKRSAHAVTFVKLTPVTSPGFWIRSPSECITQLSKMKYDPLESSDILDESELLLLHDKHKLSLWWLAAMSRRPSENEGCLHGRSSCDLSSFFHDSAKTFYHSYTKMPWGDVTTNSTSKQK